MKTYFQLLIVWGVLGVTLRFAMAAPEKTHATDEFRGKIIACEQKSGRLLLLDPDTDWSLPEAILWQWSASESADIPSEHTSWFDNVTEAKRVLHGTHMVTSASGGGIALIRMSDQKVRFYANPGGNTHSVEILPDSNLVSASSGGFLKVYCTDPEKGSKQTDPHSSTLKLAGAHGVVWDHQLQRLWAVGNTELICCKYNHQRSDPQLVIEQVISLPGRGSGHDLFPIPSTRKLFVTGFEVWTFDTATRTFADFDARAAVKSVSQLGQGGPVMYLVPSEKWWSDSVRSSDDQLIHTLPGARFYKARWWVPNPFSYGK